MEEKPSRIMFVLYTLHMVANCELETQTLLSRDLEYLNENKKESLIEKNNEVERMLMALIKSLEKKL